MLNTAYFLFAWEQTGCEITRDVDQPNPAAPADFISTVLPVYTGLARIVDITNNQIKVDENDKQNMEKYCLYIDRVYVDTIRTGDRVRFNRDELGMNLNFAAKQNENTITGYIKRIVVPQAQSLIGSLECYITTNN